MIQSSIFKAYDIRGIVPEQLNPHVAERIGRAFGTQLHTHGQKKVAIGFDGRSSSQALADALCSGLMQAGANVILLGMVTTPMTYFAAFDPDLALNSCIMITGSHNPPEYNGFKMVLNGKTMYGAEITRLYEIIQTQNYHQPEMMGNSTNYDILPHYQTQIERRTQATRPLKIVVDCGGGVPGRFNPDILQHLGHEVDRLYCDVDPHFLNHHPDPAQPKNLVELIARVQEKKYDFGIAFDGDGDRLGLVSATGEIIFPDRQLMLLAEDVLTTYPKACILYDVKCSAQLRHVVENHGGQAVMHRTGHSFIKAKMKEIGAVLAGEMSGHIFFADRWFGVDDALYTACRVIEILAKCDNATAMASKLKNLPNAPATPELHLPCDNAHAVIEALQQALAKQQDALQGGVLSTLDGVRVDYDTKQYQGFALMRASNTTPILVTRFEAANDQQLQQLQAHWQDVLKDFLCIPS